MIRYKLNPLILLVVRSAVSKRLQRSHALLQNNDGYTIERAIRDNTYNDIQPWLYHQLPEVFGGKRGSDCKTEGEFEQALKKRNAGELQFVEVHTGRWDMPPRMSMTPPPDADRLPVLKAAGSAMRTANA